MTADAPDAATRSTQPGAAGLGIAIAIASAATFATSGPLGRVLLDSGWSPVAAVAVRVLGGAALLTVPAVISLRGRWSLLRGASPQVLAYGVLAVAATQVCFFYAVARIDVGVALLIEYLAIIVVVAWMWARPGQRPTRRTAVGAVVAIGGLVLVLDLLGQQTSVDVVGVLWALGAMLGLTAYFVLSGDSSSQLPPLVLVWAGLLLGGVLLAASGATGLLPWSWSTDPVRFASGSAPWWVPVAGLVVLAAAVAYCTGVVAARRLGPRLASFVGLFEVVAAVLLAWLLLAQAPGVVQAVGGVLVLVGIVVAKAGERQVALAAVEPVSDPRVGRP